MRTTLTLDDDLAAKLVSLARRTGRPFRDVVNETLRQGLLQQPPSQTASERFVVRARDLGEVTPGLNMDNIGELLEQLEGPWHR